MRLWSLLALLDYIQDKCQTMENIVNAFDWIHDRLEGHRFSISPGAGKDGSIKTNLYQMIQYQAKNIQHHIQEINENQVQK